MADGQGGSGTNSAVRRVSRLDHRAAREIIRPQSADLDGLGKFASEQEQKAIPFN
jgi:hypothetical protein